MLTLERTDSFFNFCTKKIFISLEKVVHLEINKKSTLQLFEIALNYVFNNSNL